MRTDLYKSEDLNMAILEVACNCQTETLELIDTIPVTFVTLERDQSAWLLQRAADMLKVE